MSRPRVLFIIGQLVRGGAEQQLHELLAHADLDALVIALSPGGYWAGPIRDLGVRVIELERRGHADARRLWQVARLIRAFRPDLIHVVVDGINGLYGRLGALLTGSRNIVVEQRSHPTYFPGWYLALLPWLNHGIRGVISTSYAARDYLVEQRRVPPDKVCVIPSGIQTARFAEIPGGAGWPWPEDWRGKVIVGTVGHLTTAKSPETFIKMAAHARQECPDLRFALVGDGPLCAEMQSLVDARGVGDILQLVGERRDIPALLHTWDIFVLNSRSEGLPVAIIEAMAAGLPCVVTDTGDCGAVVVPGETGVVVPVGDAEGLARHVAALAADPARRRQLGSAGQARARREFDVSVMAQRYQSLYRRLIADRGAPFNAEEARHA